MSTSEVQPDSEAPRELRNRALRAQAALIVGVWKHLGSAPRDLDGDDLIRWLVEHAGRKAVRAYADVLDETFEHPEAMLKEHERAFLEAFAVMVRERG